MIKYAKVVDEFTGRCQIGTGTNIEFYKKLGMTLLNVEQAYNGSWYLFGKAPQESEEEKKAKRRTEILAELSALDEKAVRPMRAIASGVGTDEDREFLLNIETQAEELREELRNL